MRHCRAALAPSALFLVLAAGVPLFGQGMQLSVTNESGLAGSTIVADVLFDNDQPIMGFSFGLRHDAARLTPILVAQGPAVQARNGGAGADYFFTDLTAANGPGLIVACIFTFGGPIDTLPVGIDHPAVVVTYAASAGAPPATTTAITPASDLGIPPTNIVFSVNGVSFFPTTTPGIVTFLVPAPTNANCTLSDACDCSFALSWTNSAAYNSIQVRRDGTLIATLPGSATSTMVSLPGPGTGQICVRGVVGALSSPDACCTANCPVITPAPPPTGLACSITSADPVLGCSVDVTWNLAGVYTSISVLRDGVVVLSLPGTATSAVVQLAVDVDSQQICLEATDECGAPIAATVCCDVTCLPGTPYIRGDCNVDGGIDIGDVISLLNVLFAGAGPAACDDACDNNDDGGFDISDGVYLLSTLFSSGPPPPPPHPACGIDTTSDALDCDDFLGC